MFCVFVCFFGVVYILLLHPHNQRERQRLRYVSAGNLPEWISAVYMKVFRALPLFIPGLLTRMAHVKWVFLSLKSLFYYKSYFAPNTVLCVLCLKIIQMGKRNQKKKALLVELNLATLGVFGRHDWYTLQISKKATTQNVITCASCLELNYRGFTTAL